MSKEKQPLLFRKRLFLGKGLMSVSVVALTIEQKGDSK